MDAKDISDVVERSLADVSDIRLAGRIRELLVYPYAVERPWDYGEPEE